jgi:hypothetical protein
MLPVRDQYTALLTHPRADPQASGPEHLDYPAAADIGDSDPFAGKLTKFAIAQQGGTWTGLASDLLAVIPAPDPVPRGWPKDATRLGVWVRRFGRVMESAAGIRITKEERSSEGQPYTVEVVSGSAREITVGNQLHQLHSTMAVLLPARTASQLV